MERGRKAARIGLDSEKDIIHMINTNKKFHDSIRRSLLALGFSPQKRLIATKDDVKTDIFMKIDGDIGVSIKSSTKTSFHHLDRRWIEQWKVFLHMPDVIFETLKGAILRIARNPREKFILEKDRGKITAFLAKHLKVILTEIFMKGEQNLKLFMINDKRCRILYVYKMMDVLTFLFENASDHISFSNKGIVRLGDFITIQRKSGNGKHITLPKTHYRHPGNQLQFKFSPLKFTDHIQETNAITFYPIQY